MPNIATIEPPPSNNAGIKITNLHNLYMPRMRKHRQSWRKGVVIGCGTILVVAVLWLAFGTFVQGEVTL